MEIVKPHLFEVLNDKPVEETLMKLYKETVRQWPSLLWYFLPDLPKLWSKSGLAWSNRKVDFFKDKYIPIDPSQGSFMYLLARNVKAKNIVEFGTSYGISTLYLAKAAKENGGKVISTENVPEKAAKARQHINEAGLGDFVEIWDGDARETLQNIPDEIDFVLLDGWPDLVFPIFKILKPRLKHNAVLLVDDVKEYKASMLDYLNYVRNPKNGFISSTISLKKTLELTIKI